MQGPRDSVMKGTDTSSVVMEGETLIKLVIGGSSDKCYKMEVLIVTRACTGEEV